VVNPKPEPDLRDNRPAELVKLEKIHRVREPHALGLPLLV